MSRLIYLILLFTGLGLLGFGAIGLYNSTLDSRIYVLIISVFSSGVLLTLAVNGLKSKK